MKEPKLNLLQLDGEAETVRENDRRIRTYNKEMLEYQDFLNYVTTKKQKPVLQVSESPNDSMNERQNIIYKESFERQTAAYNEWLKAVKEFENQTAETENENNAEAK